MDNDLQLQINKLRQDLQDLNDEFYRGVFTSQQDFSRAVNFLSRVKLPSYTTLPTSCDIGELAVSGGKLYVCSAANTWTVAGTQS
jgi:hypothetical protein